MKKVTYITLAVVTLALGFTSCKKYLDEVAPNPNNPSTISANALLANIELSTFTNYNGNLNRRAAVFTQHMAGIDGQYVGVANYQINEGDVTGEWSNLYANALINCQLLIDNYGAKSPYMDGLAKILKAMNLGQATDMWGDVPNREAYKAQDRNFSAHFDAQQTVLQDIQTMLSEAIADLERPSTDNLYIPGTYDYMFGGNTESWIGVAFVMKARYANRLSQINSTQSATDALSYLDSAYAHGFTSSAGDANAKFGISANENNQWFAFENQRGYLKMGKFFIDTLVSTADPRLPFFATTDASGVTYTGADTDPNNATFDESALGSFYGSPNSKAPIVTFVEAKFIEAEAQLRAGNAGASATAHNAAITASLTDVTGAADPTYVAAFASETSGSISLAKVMMQKYIALFTQSETWADWRRTGFPALTPNPSGVVAGIPTILPTSRDERNYNPNATPVVSNVLQKVWWDQ